MGGTRHVTDGTAGRGESLPIPRWSGESLEGAVACLKYYITRRISRRRKS